MLAADHRSRSSSDAGSLAGLRTAQTAWAATPLRQRLRVVERARHLIAERAARFAQTIARPAASTLTAEVLPLCEACRFLEREAEALLAPYRPGTRSRPLWLRSVELEVRREPFGLVLVIGPANYPLLLPAVHVFQALTAGNAVVLKPGRGGWRAASLLAETLMDAGLNPRLLLVVDEHPASAQAAIAEGVDKVVLTGSFESGRAVMQQLVAQTTPSVMELSGDDPVFVLNDADPERVNKALRFATSLNGGQTCIAPKRVFASRAMVQRLDTDLPVIIVASEDEALQRAAESPYALGATVFGSERRARAFAKRVRAGVVVINDAVVPTADPRLPFGGRGHSGFGVTRGAEGLLEMTAIKAVATRRGRWLPHLEAEHPRDAELFTHFIGALHGRTWKRRLRSWMDVTRAAIARRKG